MSEHISGESTVPISEVDSKSLDAFITIADEAIMQERIQDPVESLLLSYLLHEVTEHGYGKPDEPIGERTRGPLAQLFMETFALRRRMGQNADPGYVWRLAEFSIDMLLRDTFPDDYVRHGADPRWWRETQPLQRLDHYALRVEMLGELISSMPDAYAIYQILSAAIEEHNPSYRPIVLDNATGGAKGIKKWVGPGFTSPKIYHEIDEDDPIAPEFLIPDQETQEIVDRLTARGPVVEGIVAYDQVPNDPALPGYDTAVKRLFSHTFPMSEAVRRPDEVKEFLYLDSLRPSNIFLPRTRLKAEDPRSVDEIKSFLPGGQADLGIYSAVLFQQTPDKLAAIREHQRDLYKKGGIVFEADFFARPTRNHPAGTRFIREDWWHHPGSFAVIARDPHSDEPAVELARFLTRRGTEMWFTKAGKQFLKSGSLEQARNK